MASFEPRNLTFELDDSVRHWHGGRASVTTFFDNLSIFFPAGERFFIAAVRSHLPQVKDARLLEDARAFCAQEGIHGREHDRYNEMLQRQGYPAEEMEVRVKRLLRRVEKRTTPRMRLAITCALEHFTALMGHLLLEDTRNLEGATPVMASLWRWHAAEENEHKAVAYDVYRAAHGPYTERISVMLAATVIFWAKVIEHQVRMMKTDGTLTSPREWLALTYFLFVKPGTLRRMLRPYFAYYRPSFHPRDIDSSAILDDWKSQLTV
jgi:predicted metal-dependent hydrolase